MGYRFETIDVFTDRRFGGNPLAVFVEASGLTDGEMQSLASEMNLSETTFVLPPADPLNSARLRIFNRTAEMAFAGHPCIGTAFVLARRSSERLPIVRLEVPAGLVSVEIERSGPRPIGGRLHAPQHLSVGQEFSAADIAACVGIKANEVVVTYHSPVSASVGIPFVIAQVELEVLARCVPDLRAFRRLADLHPSLDGRLSLHLYARDGANLRARMFAPLAGTIEDPATGSANAALGALLLSLTDRPAAEFTVRQGDEMGRPSVLHVLAHRVGEHFEAQVGGRCVPVLSGTALVGEEDASA